MAESTEGSEQDKSWGLLPLTPKYNKNEHENYVAEIERALNTQPSVLNIAISADYGLGKSSILNKVKENHGDSAIVISLSTLNPKERAEKSEQCPEAESITNQIQKAIVKQLISMEPPAVAQRSSFRRIELYRWPRALLFSLLITLFYAVGSVFVHSVFSSQGWNWWADGIVLAVSLIVLFCATLLGYWMFSGTVSIRQLSFKSMSLSLDRNSENYFDQYFAEISYFFKAQPEIDVVIFEDIDRFNDPLIFDSLRELNTLINNIRCRDKQKRVRFIYATRDSIFGNLTDVKKENTIVPGSSRTKFFDLIIPIVPFISAWNSRDHIKKLFEDCPGNKDGARLANLFDNNLLDLIIKYMPDTRAIKQLRNEYIVFYERLIKEGDKSLDLNSNELLAMLAVKVAYPSEFEKSRRGEGILEDVYQASRNFRAELLDRNRRTLDSRSIEQSRIKRLDKRAEELGITLDGYLVGVAHAIDYENPVYEITIDDEEFAQEGIRTSKFWKCFADYLKEGEKTIKVTYSHSLYETDTLNFDSDDICRVLGLKNTLSDWDEGVAEHLSDEISSLERQKKEIESSSISELIKHNNWVIGDAEKSSFFSKIKPTVSPYLMLEEFLYEGYIKANYVLYTSSFNGGKLTANALNFDFHHIQTGHPDYYYKLDNNDIDSLINSQDHQDFGRPGFLNFDILNYLFYRLDEEHDSVFERASSTLLKALSKLSEDGVHFIGHYLINEPVMSENENRENRYSIALEQFIQQLAAISPRIFECFITEEIDYEVYEMPGNSYEFENAGYSDAQFEDMLKYGGCLLKFIDIAFAHVSLDTQYVITERAKDYLSNHYYDLAEIRRTDPQGAMYVNIADPDAVCALIRQLDIYDVALERLDHKVRRGLIAINQYEVTIANIKLLTDLESEKITLDKLKFHFSDVYDFVLRRLQENFEELYTEEYLKCHDVEQLPGVLNDLYNANPDAIEVLFQKSASECIVQDISEVNEDVWPILAKERKFASTFHNVWKYYDNAQRKIDQDLKNYLLGIEGIGDAISEEEYKKIELAQAIINIDVHSNHNRNQIAKLVRSLSLQKPLAVKDIPFDDIALVLALVEHGVIAQDYDLYEKVALQGWPCLRNFIAETTGFVECVSPELVGQNLLNLLQSKLISGNIKDKVLSDLEQYVDRYGAKAENPNYGQIISYIADNKKSISATSLLALVKAAKADEADSLHELEKLKIITVIPLLYDSDNSTVVNVILEDLGEPYSWLATPNARRLSLERSSEHYGLLGLLMEEDGYYVNTVPNLYDGDDPFRVNMKRQ
ncbi:YobI family P-loop NTPase [Arcanobacterium phocae]|uniref:YobI family P-loop NTPase n=1 Tax=Arcanobacterium phocae TaxID=131112 RepID=UPI001C0EA162|nr:hypothetical protein [Arcanobacterium phocae]